VTTSIRKIRVAQFSRLDRQNTIGEELLFEGQQHKQMVLSTIGINHKEETMDALPEKRNQGQRYCVTKARPGIVTPPFRLQRED
jgi:hypothetical protein